MKDIIDGVIEIAKDADPNTRIAAAAFIAIVAVVQALKS